MSIVLMAAALGQITFINVVKFVCHLVGNLLAELAGAGAGWRERESAAQQVKSPSKMAARVTGRGRPDRRRSIFQSADGNLPSLALQFKHWFSRENYETGQHQQAGFPIS